MTSVTIRSFKFVLLFLFGFSATCSVFYLQCNSTLKARIQANTTLGANKVKNNVRLKKNTTLVANKANGITHATWDAVDEENAVNDTVRVDVENYVRLKIGILIPATSRGTKHKTFYDKPLYKASIPSALNTLENLYDYSLYIGIDRGDPLEKELNLIKNMSKLIIPVVVNSTNFCTTVNTIAARAYRDEMDYMVRINDDSMFVTQNWTTIAITALLAYVPSNVGVVGPLCREGATRILTHDMVHRSHMKIFGFYYPPEFNNWSTDTWMSIVYGPARTRRLWTWTVKHTQMDGQRYTPQPHVQRLTRIKSINDIDTPKLEAYLNSIS